MTTIDGAVIADDAAANDDDERISYRGVFQRTLVRPEIGATIAAVSIWIFFWAVSTPFGKASGASSILDVASSPLGIMAVAVAMLMIGGEFDLSAGAATGALGIVVILLVRDVAGEVSGGSLSLWIALPVSLLVALFLGWFNATMVDKTSLPSFVVTLASFFILKGAKLGYAKLITGQIQVGKLDDLAIHAEQNDVSDKGYGFLAKVFSGEWIRNEHVWGSRDAVYLIGVMLGLSLVVLAVYEMQYTRREKPAPAGIGVLGAGIVVAIVGAAVLHRTDSVSGNVIGAVVIGVGMLIGLFGWSTWRYQTIDRTARLTMPASAIAPFGLGLVAVVLGALFALLLDPDNSDTIAVLYQVTEQGLRAILFISLAGAGAVLMLIAVSRARKESNTAGGLLLLMTSGVVAAVAFFIRSESGTHKFRTEALSAMLAIAMLMAIWALLSMRFESRSAIDRSADRLGKILLIGGAAGVVVGLGARLLYITPEELETATRTVFSVRILWFIAFTAVCTWVLGRTRFGSWTFAVGGNKQAARQVGVPASRTKMQLFMLVSFAAWLVGILLAFRLNTIQASTGDGEEFEYIIAAVVGGTALTGGYGSTLGAAIGAFIMAMAVQGIPSARWNSDWRFVFLGAILLLAVIANNFIKEKAEAAR